MSLSTAAAPLDGIRVLELARILAGPWCGQLLADLGADVVKVERAGSGDDTRQWGPPFVAARNGGEAGDLGAAYFHSCNRGKRCIAADFETAAGQALVRRLAAHADVVIENFKVGGLKRYGLDPESLRALNPRLVVYSISGFGQDGPYAARAGYDFLIQGMGGAMSITGEPDGAPTKSGMAIADLFTGLYAANAIQAALIRRAATGEGAWIDCALLDSQVAMLSFQATNFLVSGRDPRRFGNAHPVLVPYDLFPVADGHIIVATGNDGQFRRLCGILRAPALAADPDYLVNKDRVANRDALTARLQELTSLWRRDDLLARLDAAHVPAGPINSVAQVFADPQVRARGMAIELDNPAAAGGATPGVRSPILIDGVPQASPRPAPGLDQHGAEIMADPAWGGGGGEP